MRKFKDVKFTDGDFAMINNLIDKMGLNGEKKFSEALDDLDRKYNISQDEKKVNTMLIVLKDMIN